jgi:predicted  nucleic acid-binding Zn-ribbon protein
MSEERHEIITEDATAPRWVGIIVVALAVVSLAALGAGWTASTRSKELAQTLATQTQQLKQNEDVLNQRLAKAEDTNAQLQGELSVVTDKMKLTQGELKKARQQAAKIKDEDAKELAELQNQTTAQLATKASVDDVNKLGTDVTGVKSDLSATKNDLQMARGEFGTLIARNHDEVEELRRRGDRDYYEFTIEKKNARQKVGDLMVELKGVNTKKNLYTVSLFVDDARYEKRNKSANEPIYFFIHGSRTPLEFTVNSIGKDKITGYLSVPKVNTAHAQASGNGN